MTIHEFEGVQYRAKYTEFGDCVMGDVRLPSGSVVSWEIERENAHSNFFDHGGRDLRSGADREVADRLFPAGPGPGGRSFRRAAPEFAAVAWATASADPDIPAKPWQPTAADARETFALAELEGTPMRAPRRRPDRTCVECGSPVYGDSCTHCHEG